MINSLLSSIFGCSHSRTTFPLTPSRKSQKSEGVRTGTYIVCLDCGKEFAYNWKEMRIGAPVRRENPVPLPIAGAAAAAGHPVAH